MIETHHALNTVPDTRNFVDDSLRCMQTFLMGRPKQFEERIQLTLVDGTTDRIDALLAEGEYRLDFIRTAIEVEIVKRSLDTSANGGKRQAPLE